MIELTRFNGSVLILNSDLIMTVDASPDTMLTLTNGEKMIVRETCAEVVKRVLAYRARLLARVARQLKSSGDFEPIAAVANLDLTSQTDQSGSPQTSRPKRHRSGTAPGS